MKKIHLLRYWGDLCKTEINKSCAILYNIHAISTKICFVHEIVKSTFIVEHVRFRNNLKCGFNIFQKSRFQTIAELRRKQARSFELSIFKSGERFRFFSFFEAKGLSSHLRMRVLVQAGHQMPCYVSCFVKKTFSVILF